MTRKAHKPVASKRIAWPEPGYHNSGGEFRMTWGRLTAILGTLLTLMLLFPAYWAISDHWMNRIEIEKKIKDHADHDAGVQSWNAYGFAANRVEYLDDKKAECEAKRMVAQKLPPIDAALCTRYEDKLKAKSSEAADLKTKALETTKEKP